MVIFFLFLWYLTGFAGFVFWYTKDHNVDIGGLLLGLLVCLMGPFTWIVGWVIHGDMPTGDRIYFKKRG